MRLLSLTLTNSRADVIERALAAIAPEVDACLILDTGATDNTMALAEATVRAAGKEFLAAELPWVDFSQARNAALNAGRRHGADWTIFADTDDRMHVPGLRDYLATVPAEQNVVMVPHSTRAFSQTRIVRRDAPGKYRMPVHEAFEPHNGKPGPAEWYFECMPRPAEDLREKYERYAAILERHAQLGPPVERPRALYYLGDTYCILQYYGKAIKAFEACLAAPGWDEQAAWAGWRSALAQAELGLIEGARGTIARALARRPDNMAELHWLAGWLAYQAGEYRSARAAAQRALEIGPVPRPGFCHPDAQGKLPRELLQWCDFQLSGGQLGAPPGPNL